MTLLGDRSALFAHACKHNLRLAESNFIFQVIYSLNNLFHILLKPKKCKKRKQQQKQQQKPLLLETAVNLIDLKNESNLQSTPTYPA